MSNTTQVLIQFKNALTTFLDELINQFPEDGDLIMFRIFIKDRIPILDVMNLFIRNLLPKKKMILDKNEDYFLNYCNLLEMGKENENKSKENKNKVNKFKKIWRSERLDKEDKMVIWKWFESFIYLAEKYQKNLEKKYPDDWKFSL